MKKIPVGLMGYGSQGRRIAEAIRHQTDVNLIGVGLNKPDLSAKMAHENEYPLYAIDPEAFQEHDINIKGSVTELLSKTEVVVDATPAGIGEENKARLYNKQDCKVIFQGGERFDVATIPVFLSHINYESAHNVKYLRIPYPYTVSTVRVLEPIDTTFGVKGFSSTFVLAGSEPNRAISGPLDTIIPKSTEHLRILKEEMEKLRFRPRMLSAFRIPTLLLSAQSILIELESTVSKEDITTLLRAQPRIELVPAELQATDMIFEFLRRRRHTQGDVYEICVWENQIECEKHYVKLVFAFNNHCVQTPHIIDAIRALTTDIEQAESEKRTNTALSIGSHTRVY